MKNPMISTVSLFWDWSKLSSLVSTTEKWDTAAVLSITFTNAFLLNHVYHAIIWNYYKVHNIFFPLLCKFLFLPNRMYGIGEGGKSGFLLTVKQLITSHLTVLCCNHVKSNPISVSCSNSMNYWIHCQTLKYVVIKHHAMKECRGHGNKVPHFLNLSSTG